MQFIPSTAVAAPPDVRIGQTQPERDDERVSDETHEQQNGRQHEQVAHHVFPLEHLAKLSPDSKPDRREQ